MKRRILVFGFFSILATLLVASGLLIWAYRATQSVPGFYQEALIVPPEVFAEAGDRFEKQVLELHNETQRDGHWEVVFTDKEINGWLAAELPEKFPHLLPREVQDPRVAILSQHVLIGCRYIHESVTTIFSLELEPYLPEELNCIAIRVGKARAGALPVPIRQVMEHATQAAQKADLMIRWREQAGEPVAIISLPAAKMDNQKVELSSIELRNGALVVHGRTLLKASEPNSGD